MKEEHYGKPTCQVSWTGEEKRLHHSSYEQECDDTRIEHVFRNERLERLSEIYNQRKSTTLSLLEWIKNLE